MYIQTCPPFPSYPRDPCLEPYEEESSDLLLLGCVYATISAANFPPEFPRRKLSKWTCNSCYRHSWWKLARVTPLYNVQRARTTYACYERQLLIVARPSLALHRVLPPLPLLHYFFFFFSLLISFHPSRFSYSPSSTRSPNLRYVPILRDSRSSYWRFKSLRNCVRQRERDRGEKPVESLKRERRYESTAVSRNERRRIGKPDAVGATTLDADDSQTLSSQLSDDSCDNKRGTRVSEPEGAPLRLSFSKLRKPINSRPFFPLINFLPARRGRERK